MMKKKLRCEVRAARPVRVVEEEEEEEAHSARGALLSRGWDSLP
jgi:hypothetical protein